MHDPKIGEAEKKGSKVSEKRIYRRAGIKDVDDIYRIACKMQLVNKPKLMSSRGFLINHYTSNPEIKDQIADDIYETIFLVCETKKGILGFLQGYNSEQWLKIRPNLSGANSTKILWIEEALKKMGIKSMNNFNSFGVIDKVSVDKTLDKKAVAYNLIRLFTKLLLENEKKFVMSEIVTRVYDNNKLLDIKNKASIRFHKKLGFYKVGETEKYSFNDSFLKSDGFLQDAIYLARINDLPYKYKRIFKAIR